MQNNLGPVVVEVVVEVALLQVFYTCILYSVIVFPKSWAGFAKNHRPSDFHCSLEEDLFDIVQQHPNHKHKLDMVRAVLLAVLERHKFFLASHHFREHLLCCDNMFFLIHLAVFPLFQEESVGHYLPDFSRSWYTSPFYS